MSTATKENVSKKTTRSTAKKSAPANKSNSSVAKSSAPAKQTSKKEETRYFNEYGSGLAYVNGISQFEDNGKTRTHLHLSVIQGPENNVHYEYHRLMVLSEYAYEVIMLHQEAIETKGTKVLIRFKMVNPRVEKFIKRSNELASDFATCIGGILTRILTMKIEGTMVFEDTRTFEHSYTESKSLTDHSFDDDIPF